MQAIEYDNRHAYTIEREQFPHMFFVVSRISRTGYKTRFEAEQALVELQGLLTGTFLSDPTMRIEVGLAE